MFEHVFEGAPAGAARAALHAYVNADGGFGHALEPDVRAPSSQGLFADYAFELLAMIDGGFADPMVRRCCDWLSDQGDGVGLVDERIEGFPKAAHWAYASAEPKLNPTAGLAAALIAHDIDHAWRDRAVDFTWAALEQEELVDGHTLYCVFKFLDVTPEGERARPVIEKATEAVKEARFVVSDPRSKEYGKTPLDFAPTPDSRWRGLWSDRVIEAFLDRLEGLQAEDGGWPIAWEPPSAAAVAEWRGRWTLDALRVLRAYGRV